MVNLSSVQPLVKQSQAGGQHKPLWPPVVCVFVWERERERDEFGKRST